MRDPSDVHDPAYAKGSTVSPGSPRNDRDGLSKDKIQQGGAAAQERCCPPVEQDVSLDFIDPTGGTQMRDSVRTEVVAQYRERMDAGDVFPPVVLFQDGQSYWIADGFHRIQAARLGGAKEIRALVHVGTLSDAIQHATGANRAHGLPRTQADKRRAIRAALEHERMREWSDRAIAKHVGVDHKTVAAMRRGEPGFSPVAIQPAPATRVGRDGKRRRAPRRRTRTGAPSPARLEQLGREIQEDLAELRKLESETSEAEAALKQSRDEVARLRAAIQPGDLDAELASLNNRLVKLARASGERDRRTIAHELKVIAEMIEAMGGEP